MTQFIVVFGLLICLAGMVIVFNPELVFGFLRKNCDKIEIHIAAVVVRLVLGLILIDQAAISKFPLAIEVIGWISIVAAVFLALLGRSNFIKLMRWALSPAAAIGRVGGLLASIFGLFLVYAFV